jgi:hypothetical protein
LREELDKKHYAIRNQFGENDGRKREGIDLESVASLVESSLKHLIFYSLKVKNFLVVTRDDAPRGERFQVGLQKYCVDEMMLNVVIETHLLNLDKYEVTIKTAMKINDFFKRTGEYIIEMVNEDSSILKQVDQTGIREVFRYN